MKFIKFSNLKKQLHMHVLKTKDGRVIKPYSYQKTSFKLLVAALQTNYRALMIMATGLGKTITSILVLLHFLKPKNRVLFLCHDTGILDQSYAEFSRFIFRGGYSSTKFYGKKKDWHADTHNIVFATFQSLASHLADKKKKNIFSKTHFDYIIVDEGHHAKASSYETVLNYFTPKWKMAMTATPDREDQEDIREIFGDPVVNIELPEALAKGWLTPVDYRVLSDGLDEDKIAQLVAEVMYDNVRITEKQINERIFVKVRTKEQVKEILKESKNKQAIIFCQNITHLRHMAEFLPQSVWVHSDQTTEENKEAMQAFKEKKARHVLVVDKFNEGIDIPDVELIIFLRGTDSRRIFLQQLGRGLRKFLNKKQVTIMDFVGNVTRIQEIRNLVEHVQSLLPKARGRKRQNFVPLHVDGTGFSFKFTKQIADLLKVFDKSKEEFYSTWEEASRAAIKLGLKTVAQYVLDYKQDIKLPSNPDQIYGNKFPGFIIFLGGQIRNYYPTWQEASKATLKLGIKTSSEYAKKFKKDSRLPGRLDKTYPDFPGFSAFLKRRSVEGFYSTWQEASEAAKRLNISTQREYKAKYKNDLCLPSFPERYFDFPGFTVFLRGEIRDFYSTWQEASEAVQTLKIDSAIEYKKRYKESNRLHSNPNKFYSDFPGWPKFLGKV